MSRHDKLSTSQVYEAFGDILPSIYKDKTRELTYQLIPVYDMQDRINAWTGADSDKELLKTFIPIQCTSVQIQALNALNHMERIMKMVRFNGIGGRNRPRGMVPLPIEEAKQINFEDIHEFKGIKRNRGGFKALCPLHDEKTSSFSVKGKLFKCFGCGKSGSTIDFVMELYGLSFVDSVKRLTGVKNEIK